jgi:HSP20 family molecular chaperone IbpA
MSHSDDIGQPAVDLFRRGETYHALVDLPGVPASQVTVRLSNHDVLVEAESQILVTPTDQILVAERSTAGRKRRFRLPSDADPSTVVADCSDGLLHLAASIVEQPPAAAGGERHVEIQTGGLQLAPAEVRQDDQSPRAPDPEPPRRGNSHLDERL